MNELLACSLTELAARLRERRASPVELMEAVLARIDETNRDLNAFVALRGIRTGPSAGRNRMCSEIAIQAVNGCLGGKA